MTKDEALKMCLEYIETNAQGSKFAILIKEALAQPEPEYLAFMDTPQRKPLTDEEIQDLLMPVRISGDGYYLRIARAIEAAHGIKGEA